MKKLILINFLFISSLTFSQDSKALKSFQKILKEHNLIFDMPDGYSETKVKSNIDLGYLYAIKHNSAKLEIRYTLFSIKTVIEKNKTSGGVTTDPNRAYPVMVSTHQLNLSGGNEYQVTRFAPEDVQGEFLADDGGTTYFPLDSEFGEGYENCVMVFLHRQNIADAYILYLFDDPEVYQSNAENAFYALTFDE